MLRRFLSIFLLLAIPLVFAQPGANTGTLKFKVYRNGKLADLRNKDWKIAMHHITDPVERYAAPAFYEVSPKATPIGGLVGPNFSFDVIFKKDTMTIFPPSFSFTDIVLDSIPFQKGVFKIPEHIYHLQYKTKYKHVNYIPRMNGDWNLFQGRRYCCFVEKIEDMDQVSQNTYTAYTNEFDYILIPDRRYYYFKDNVIITTDDDTNYAIYEVKDISEVSFWNKRQRENRFIVRSLFHKDANLYAIIMKTYNGYSSGNSYGVYKLHFIDEEIPGGLASDLEAKQLTEDYEAITKFTNKDPASWHGDDFGEIKSAYENRLKAFKKI